VLFTFNVLIPFWFLSFYNGQHFSSSGRRIFDVWVQGALAANDLDIFASVGRETAYIVDVTASALNAIEIVLEPVKENPMISAIEIIYLESAPAPAPVPAPLPAPVPAPVPMPTTPAPMVAPTTPAPVVAPTTLAPVVAPTTPVPAPMPTGGPFQDLLINCGGPQYIEAAGVRTWKADQYFVGGGTYNRGTLAIDNTLDDKVYQSERNGAFTYEIPVPPSKNSIGHVLHGCFKVSLTFSAYFLPFPTPQVTMKSSCTLQR